MISLRSAFFSAAVCFLASCATQETKPDVRVLPNDSGLRCSDFAFRPPHWWMGAAWDMQGNLRPPNIPSGMHASVRRVNPILLRNIYRVSASNSLSVLSVERARSNRATHYHLRDDVLLLEKALRTRQPSLICTQSGGDEVPWMNAARCFHAKARIVDFPWGRAVLFLTTYVQGPNDSPVNNDMLVLVVQGLTNDGRYAVSGHFDIRHPLLPDTMDDSRAKGRAYFSLEGETEAAEAWLNRQPDDSFRPSFAQYEKLLASLEIKSTGEAVPLSAAAPASASSGGNR